MFAAIPQLSLIASRPRSEQKSQPRANVRTSWDQKEAEAGRLSLSLELEAHVIMCQQLMISAKGDLVNVTELPLLQVERYCCFRWCIVTSVSYTAQVMIQPCHCGRHSIQVLRVQVVHHPPWWDKCGTHRCRPSDVNSRLSTVDSGTVGTFTESQSECLQLLQFNRLGIVTPEITWRCKDSNLGLLPRIVVVQRCLGLLENRQANATACHAQTMPFPCNGLHRLFSQLHVCGLK